MGIGRASETLYIPNPEGNQLLSQLERDAQRHQARKPTYKE